MKKEAKLLKEKGISSILLSIDHFNRVSEVGRDDAVLIFLDHSFEMLLKAAILFKGGKIREAREANTIGFDKCVRKALSDTPFLTQEQALVLQAINGLRDAAQHHLVDLSEGQLYFHAQSGVTLFRDVLRDVFGEDLANSLPSRVLPVSTIVPTNPLEMFATELDTVKQLLAPGRRHRHEAEAKLRGLAIVDGALQGQFVQPSESELRKLGSRLTGGEKFDQLFPGIGAVTFQTSGVGPSLSLRIAKKEGVPVTVVPEGTPGAGVIALKRVDQLGFYNLGHHELAKKIGITTNKTTAAIRILGIKDDPECYKQVAIGKVKYQRYSQNAIQRIKDLLIEKTPEEIWDEYLALRASAASG
ncbi:DUF3644 domain-containing protein [Mycobacteroides chelonae]|uniref:DUF3644 domain-containing protein n=1 Tax=Mycobacteroides chelonae TaxID=1774 RepID=UPI000993A0FD|nr:DUF3644 domain-containing protein [Mycobacteroides chelonae]